ncbi:MAG TPA: 2-alkenal reductase, partial [Candidatus Omnitrophica bacterium]|nr:2-alkenal reductase [Candidatus Omnitrophota bacterium]
MKKTINIGIDLGTTNSSIALFEKNRTVVFKNFTDDELTPSVVRIDEASSLVVGRNAYQRLLDDSENTVGGFKRWMGTQQRKVFSRSGRVMTPEELSAEVLKELRIAAKETRDLDVTAAVITVPASFEVLQCDATVRAARLAGISHSPLLQEPIAASIAYGLQDK